MTRLREVREELKATREDLIRRTESISMGTIRAAELGKPIRKRNAKELVEGINALLSGKGLPPLSLEDLGLTLANE
jgi:hypothetical protein